MHHVAEPSGLPSGILCLVGVTVPTSMFANTKTYSDQKWFRSIVFWLHRFDLRSWLRPHKGFNSLIVPIANVNNSRGTIESLSIGMTKRAPHHIV